MQVRRREFVRSSLALAGVILSGIICTKPASALSLFGKKKSADTRARQIYAPDDCYVSDVYAGNGPVQKDKELFLLYSPRLEGLLSRLQTHSDMAQIFKRRMTDGRREDQKKCRNLLIDDCRLQLDAAQVRLAAAKAQHDAGLIGAEWKIAEYAFNSQRDNCISAETEFNAFDRDTADIMDRISVLERNLGKEISRMSDLISRLKVRAPMDGNLRIHCTKDLFYKKGHLLAEI